MEIGLHLIEQAQRAPKLLIFAQYTAATYCSKVFTPTLANSPSLQSSSNLGQCYKEVAYPVCIPPTHCFHLRVAMRNQTNNIFIPQAFKECSNKNKLHL